MKTNFTETILFETFWVEEFEVKTFWGNVVEQYGGAMFDGDILGEQTRQRVAEGGYRPPYILNLEDPQEPILKFL